MFFFVAVSTTSLLAQSSTGKITEVKPTEKPQTTENTVAKKTTLDTEDSFKFLGNELLFQVKKRLNLTTEEEEKKQVKSSENKKFSFFGIEIEKG